MLMRGGTLRKLVIYTDMEAPSNGIRTQHDIRMTEVQLQAKMTNQRKNPVTVDYNLCVCVLQHKWKYFNSVSEKAVSRADFMSVLSNVQYIIIKASYGTRLHQSRYKFTRTDTHTCTTLYYAILYYTILVSGIMIFHETSRHLLSVLLCKGSLISPWKWQWRLT